MLIPEDNRIADNLIVKSSRVAVDGAAQDSAAPLDIFHFKPNRFSGSVVSGGEVRLAPEGFTRKDVAPPSVPKVLTAKDAGPSWQ